ncbi:MAG: GyrI-like domain-containing protein [Oscillospiraceae bacterium]|nr:GyrI-like domain-containing protein [Oscillospiraceae bacterium]
MLEGKFPVTGFTVTACLPVGKKSAPPEAVRYPAGRALALNYRGGYYDLWKAYAALGQYINENGYVPTGYPQEIYLEIESDGSVRLDESRNVTRVIVPVKLING